MHYTDLCPPASRCMRISRLTLGDANGNLASTFALDFFIGRCTHYPETFFLLWRSMSELQGFRGFRFKLFFL